MQLTSIKPPSVFVQEKIGPQLEALGAKLVDTDAQTVEVRFADAHTTEVANAAFEGTIDGIKLLFRDSNGHGVRGVADGYKVLETVSKLPGVTDVMALESFPLQLRIKTDSAETKAAVDLLLRDETVGNESIGIS